MRRSYLGIVNEELGKDSYPFKVVELIMNKPELLWPNDLHSNKVTEIYYNANKEIVLHKTHKKGKKSSADILIPNMIPAYWDTILPKTLMFHMHSFFEICNIVSGKALYIINNNCIEVQTDDVIMFSMNKPHFWFPDPDSPPKIRVSHFFPNLLLNKNFTEEKSGFLFSLYSSDFPYLLFKKDSTINNKIRNLLDNIYDEFMAESISYQIMIIAKLLEMSSHIIRYKSSKPELQSEWLFSTKMRKGHISVNKAIDYINKNYADPELSASTISDIVSMNKNYFSTLFRDSMGMTLTSYIRNLRIAKAIELLNDQNLSITEIGYFCGYNSSSNFYRAFITVFGISPSKYKKTHLK